MRAPTARGEEFFDPGAKYHVPGNTPYARYFLAAVLQFQFHRALAKAVGLHDAAASLLDLWQRGSRRAAGEDAGDGRVAAVAGRARGADRQREMDASAIADYFAPLKTWLDEQNKGRKIGW